MSLLWLALVCALVLGCPLIWRGFMLIAAYRLIGWLFFWLGLALIASGLYGSVTLFMEGDVNMNLLKALGTPLVTLVLGFLGGAVWTLASTRLFTKPRQKNFRDTAINTLYPGLDGQDRDW